MFTSDDTSRTIEDRSHNAAAVRDRRSGQALRPTPGSLIDPVFIARAVWNARLFILAATLLGLGGGVLYAIATPKIYSATTQILMDPRDLKVVANEVTPNGLPSEATLALVESQTSVIMSSNVLSRVIAETGLEADPEFNGSQKTGVMTLLPTALADMLAAADDEPADPKFITIVGLRRAMTVARETKSFVINLSVLSRDPVKSARLANTTADVFIDEQGRVQSEAARRATEALSSRLSELRQRVVETEGRVEEYKSRNSLIGVGGRLVDDDYIVRINDQLAKARGDITALKVKADSMRNASVEDVVAGTLPEELSSEALVRLRQSYSDLAQQAAVLATKLGPRHPQRLASEGALTAAREAIAGELARIVAAAQTEFARAEETEKNLSSQIGELKVKQVETSGSFVKLRELEREVDASRAVYEAFLLRARETSEQESLNTANVRVISDATPPLEPAGVSRKILVVAGGLLGFLVGIGLAAALAVWRLSRSLFARDEPQTADRLATPAAAIPALPVDRTVDAPARPTPTPAEELRPAVYAHRGDAEDPEAPSAAARRAEDGPAYGDPARLAFDDRSAAADIRPAGRPGFRTDALAGADADALSTRAALRERVRGLSAVGGAEADAGATDRSTAAAALTPKAAALKDDLDLVKQAIAELRRRRAMS